MSSATQTSTVAPAFYVNVLDGSGRPMYRSAGGSFALFPTTEGKAINQSPKFEPFYTFSDDKNLATASLHNNSHLKGWIFTNNLELAMSSRTTYETFWDTYANGFEFTQHSDSTTVWTVFITNPLYIYGKEGWHDWRLTMDLQSVDIISELPFEWTSTGAVP